MSLPLHHVPASPDQAQAKAAAQQLLEGRSNLQLPESVSALLAEVLERLSNGEALAVLPVEELLTTQQTADLLGVSRPFLIDRVLASGSLPFQMVGKHRRIRLSDALAWQQQDVVRRTAHADELTTEADALGLY